MIPTTPLESLHPQILNYYLHYSVETSNGDIVAYTEDYFTIFNQPSLNDKYVLINHEYRWELDFLGNKMFPIPLFKWNSTGAASTDYDRAMKGI